MRPPALLLNCGEPKPGFQRLWDVILGSGVQYRSYCNGDNDGHDQVTELPFTFPSEDYVHGDALMRVSESPTDPSDNGPFRYHHAELYRSGMLKLNPVSALAPGANDVAIVNLITGIYALPGDVPIAWDHLDDGSDGDGVYWALKHLDGADVVVCRGSITKQDWIRDAMAIARTPWGQPQLGPVHQGFYLGMKDVWAEVRPMLRDNVPWVACGHSLGAGRATLLAGLACIS